MLRERFSPVKWSYIKKEGVSFNWNELLREKDFQFNIENFVFHIYESLERFNDVPLRIQFRNYAGGTATKQIPHMEKIIQR